MVGVGWGEGGGDRVGEVVVRWVAGCCSVPPVKSGARQGKSLGSRASNSLESIFEHSIVVVFFELKNVDRYDPLDSERQLSVVCLICKQVKKKLTNVQPTFASRSYKSAMVTYGFFERMR